MSTSQPLRQFASEKQELMDKLLEQNQNELLSDEDIEVLRNLVGEAEQLMIENAKSLETAIQG